MATVPPNPARDKIAAVTARTAPDAGIGPGQPPARRFSAVRRAMLAKHAGERSDMETQQWNDRIDLTERHAAEAAELEAKENPATAPAAPPAAPPARPRRGPA